DLVKNTYVKNQRKVLGAIPRRHLVDFVTRSKMPAVADYVRTASRMDGRRHELLAEADRIGKKWNRFTTLNKQHGARLAELMQASTLARVHPGRPYKAVTDPVKDAKRRGDYELLRKHWNRLPDEGKQIF